MRQVILPKRIMMTLKDNSCRYFDVIQYPDGQRSIKLKLDIMNVKHPVLIKCRIKTYSDLELLNCLMHALIKNDFYIQKVAFIYLMGMRSDRAFSLGEPNYFRDIIAPHLPAETRLCGGSYILFPHSPTVLKIAGASLFQLPCCPTQYIKDSVYLWGDESAHYLAKSFNDTLEFNRSVIGCFRKKRVGDSIEVYLDDPDLFKNIDKTTPITIIDDLCDAGGTFIAEAKYLREVMKLPNPLNLFVGHGLFTKGLDPLLNYFDRIICTNSYQDIVHPLVTQIEVI